MDNFTVGDNVKIITLGKYQNLIGVITAAHGQLYSVRINQEELGFSFFELKKIS